MADTLSEPPPCCATLRAVLENDDASRYDLFLRLQGVQWWLAGIFVVLLLILWRVW